MALTTRDRLVSAAAKLLDRGGPAAVTLRAVAEMSGVSHNAPYKHFASKDDLLAAVAARELRRLATANAKAATLAAIMRDYLRWARSYPARFKLCFGKLSAGSNDLDEAASASRSRFIAAVERAMAAGQIARSDPERTAWLILSLAHGAADLALSGHLSAKGKGRADPEDLMDDLLKLLKP